MFSIYIFIIKEKISRHKNSAEGVEHIYINVGDANKGECLEKGDDTMEETTMNTFREALSTAINTSDEFQYEQYYASPI